MIVNQLMVHQAVKVGANYVTSFTPDRFSIEFNSALQCWKMTERKTGIIVMVSMYNVPWFGINGEKNEPRKSDRSDKSNEGNGSDDFRAGDSEGSVPPSSDGIAPKPARKPKG